MFDDDMCSVADKLSIHFMSILMLCCWPTILKARYSEGPTPLFLHFNSYFACV